MKSNNILTFIYLSISLILVILSGCKKDNIKNCNLSGDWKAITAYDGNSVSTDLEIESEVLELIEAVEAANEVQTVSYVSHNFKDDNYNLLEDCTTIEQIGLLDIDTLVNIYQENDLLGLYSNFYNEYTIYRRD